MMTGDPQHSVNKLRDLAANLNITGNSNEQAFLLAVLDTLDIFAETIRKNIDAMGIYDEQVSAGALFSKCPSCGETISLDLSTLYAGQSMLCTNCHEEIAVITSSTL